MENLDQEWFLANDSEITEVSFENLVSNQTLFKNDTPYVLFYRRLSSLDSDLTISVPNTKLVEIIENDNALYEREMATRATKAKFDLKQNFRDFDEDRDGGDGNDTQRFNLPNDSDKDSGPRIVF